MSSRRSSNSPPGTLDPLSPLGTSPDFFLGVQPATAGLELQLQALVTYPNRPGGPEGFVLDPNPGSTGIDFRLASREVPAPLPLLLIGSGLILLLRRRAT